MPRLPTSARATTAPKWYLGVDPGTEGAASLIDGSSGVETIRLSTSDRDLWGWLAERRERIAFAMLEQIDPRPTMVFDHELKQVCARILKSTCLLYGDYWRLRAMLVALGTVPWLSIPPKRWQQGLDIVPKSKAETARDWKNRLKQRAEQLFPAECVVLATADSLLLARYCYTRASDGKV